MFSFRRKPSVTLENHREVYAWYRDLDNATDTRLTRLGQWGMARAFRPQVVYIGAARANIQSHLAAGGQVLLVANHVHALDPVGLAVLMSREPAFRPMRLNTTGVVKSSLMDERGDSFRDRALGKLSRFGMDAMRSIPVFRDKDILSKRDEVTKAERSLINAAGLGFIGLAVNRLEQGDNLAMFPVNGRFEETVDEVPELEMGAGLIAHKGYKATGGRLKILPIAIRYRGSRRRPSIAVGDLVSLAAPADDSQPAGAVPKPLRSQQIIDVLRPIMQSVLDAA